MEERDFQSVTVRILILNIGSTLTKCVDDRRTLRRRGSGRKPPLTFTRENYRMMRERLLKILCWQSEDAGAPNLCAQQPQYVNHAGSEKRPEDGPAKARPAPKPRLQRREVNVVVNEPNKKSCGNSKHCSWVKAFKIRSTPAFVEKLLTKGWMEKSIIDARLCLTIGKLQMPNKRSGISQGD
jgi:hypothetical protein